MDASKLARHLVRQKGLLSAVVAIAVTGTACSFVLDYDTDQCVTTADCTAGAACTDGLCVLPSAATSTGTGPGSGGGGQGSGCVSHSQCVADNGGLPYHCITPGEPCVSLLSEDCIEIYPPDAFNDDDALVFGFAADLTGPLQAAATNKKHAVTMALEDIRKSQQAGLPIGANGGRRPFVAVICDDHTDLTRAYTHLVDNLKVEAVLCGSYSDQCVEVAQSITIPAGVLHLNWHGTTNFFEMDDDGLVFNYRINNKRGALPFAVQAQEVEAQIRQERGLQPGDKLKIASIHMGSSDFALYFDEVDKVLNVNGAPVLEQVGSYYKRYDGTDDPTATAAVADVLAEFQPDIIIGGWFGAGDLIIAPIEDGWPAGQPRPHYLLIIQDSSIGPVVAARPDDDLIARVRGVYTFNPNKAALYNPFAGKFATWTDGLVPATFTETFYDAVFQLAYAYIIKRDVAVVTGKDLADGILRQNPPGVSKPVDPGEVESTVTVLINNGDIDMEGVSGNLNFDPDVGDLLGQYESWCMGDDGSGGLTFTHAGQFWDTVTEMMTGEFCCPSTMTCPSN
jgi:branched-chain amino acid transport system substrate-binding protein